MGIKGIDHWVIVAGDLRRTLDFYQQLGFTIAVDELLQHLFAGGVRDQQQEVDAIGDAAHVANRHDGRREPDPRRGRVRSLCRPTHPTRRIPAFAGMEYR